MGLCGPTGSLACAMISAFGALFLAMMAILLANDYPYLGEWFDRAAPYPDQRDRAVSGTWLVAFVYAILAVLCTGIFMYHSFRRTGYARV